MKILLVLSLVQVNKRKGKVSKCVKKMICLTLLSVSLSLGDIISGIGIKYDPIIDSERAQAATAIGYICPISYNYHFSLSGEVQSTLLDFNKVNLSFPVTIYYKLFFITNQGTVYFLDTPKEFRYKFSTGIGFQIKQRSREEIYRPIVYYDYMNKSFHGSFLFIFEL